MKAGVVSIIILIIVAVGGVVLIAHKNKSNDDMSGMKTSSSQTSTSSSAPSDATATNQVAIDNFAFSPANIKITVGTTVTWTNKDSVAHTVQETDNQDGPKSEDIATGKEFVFTYDKPGTYHYHCSIHPDMVGTVTVTAQ